MKIGRFDHKITFQYYTTVSDGIGGTIPTWVDDITVWAKIIPQRAKEAVEAGQQVAKQTYVISIRWTNDFTNPLDQQYRIMWGSKVLNIVWVRNVDLRDKVIEILVAEK